jgi:hypothetical protein
MMFRTVSFYVVLAMGFEQLHQKFSLQLLLRTGVLYCGAT